MKIAVLGSTRGTDLQGIIDARDQGQLPGIEIALVISNKKNAGILERARQHGLRAIHKSSVGLSREQYDAEISELLKEHQVDLVLLIGYMRLLSAQFVDEWQNKVINIHPSLLPAFSGGMDLNVHQAVLDRGCKLTGASLIFIDQGADTGPIISQKAVEVLSNDTAETLKQRVQAVEVELLLQALGWFRDGRISVVAGKKVKIM